MPLCWRPVSYTHLDVYKRQALTWDDENYYLVGFDSQAGIIKHFRVDKMAQIGTTEEPRDGQEVYAADVYKRQVLWYFYCTWSVSK